MVKRSILGGSIALILIVGLTGCVPSESDTGYSDRPSESEEPVVLEGDRDGDGELSEFEKQILAKNAVRDYVMPDGSVIQLDPKEPLPEEVKTALAMETQPLGNQYKTNTDFSPESVEGMHSNLRNLLDEQATATGKGIAVVFSSPDGRGGTSWGTLASNLRSTGLSAEYDQAAMVAKVQSWANAKGYEVIVLS